MSRRFVPPRATAAAAHRTSPRGAGTLDGIRRCFTWRAAAIVWLMLLGFTFAATAAHAHGSSDAYLHLERDRANATTLRTDVALRDLDRELAIDADDDRNVTWGEVRRAWPAIVDHVGSGIELRTADSACTLAPRGTTELADRAGGTHVVLRHDVSCADAAMPTHASWRLFATTDASHRGLLRIDDASRGGDAATALVVLRPSATASLLPVSGAGPRGIARDHATGAADTAAGEEAGASRGGFLHFAYEGIAHIASGADHILFLVTLIVVAVFTRVDGRWVVRASRREIVGDAVRIVTAFTVTHSITLGLAAAGAGHRLIEDRQARDGHALDCRARPFPCRGT